MNRLFRFAALFLIFSLCIPARSAHVRWTFANATNSPSASRNVFLTPLYTYSINGTNFIVGDRQQYTLDSSGSVIVSNLIAGSYRMEHIGPIRTTVVTNTIPDTNGLINAVDYSSVPAASFTAAYSQGVSDSRFIRTNTIKNYVLKGDNMTFVTNANGSLTISSSGGGTSGALTNNDTRQVTLTDRLTIGSGATDGRIILTDGEAKSYTAIVGDSGWQFSQPIEANGSLLTALSGANITAGTISTNKMDATAYAAFIGGGGSGDVITSLTNYGIYGSNNLSGQIVATVRSNSLVVGNPNRSNGVIHIKDGAIWMPSARAWNDTPGTSTYTENKHSGAIYWHGALGTNLNEPRLDSENQDGFAKIGAWYYWGGSATYPSGNPWLKISAREVRLEEAYANDGTLGRQIQIGNEDHFGRVFFNYTPTANGQTNASGRGRPVGFTALATDANGAYDNYAQPGIQSVAIPGANRVTVGADTYGLGELRFYAAVPSPSTAFQTNTWNATPGVEVMRMRTNGFTVIGDGGIIGNGDGITNVNMTNITFTPNGIARVAHNFSFKTTNSSQPGVLAFNATAHGAGRGIVLLGATEGDVVINPMSAGGILQLGMSGTSGSYNYMQYASFPTASFPVGFSHPLQFRSTSYNGGATAYKYPGIVGFPSADDASELGKISIYARAPHWNSGNADQSSPNEAGTKVVDFDTNGIVAAPNIVFKGNGAGITNQNYAIFQQVYAGGTTRATIPATTWTNIIWTTNIAAMSFDSASAFTLSNNLIIVNSNGAGRWRVRSSVPFYNNNTGNTGACMTRMYRVNNTPATLAQGQSVYQYGYSCPDSRIAAVVTLAAGDVFAIQAWAASTTDTQFGVNNGSGENQVASILEMERQ